MLPQTKFERCTIMNVKHSPLRIDIVSDVVCPWCIVGYRQLSEALEATGVEYEIHWHPFELNPGMAAEGQDGYEHVAEKYGTSRQDSDKSRARLSRIGAELGFEFKMPASFRMHNTFNAHQLLHWANLQEKETELKLALFTAHFTDNRNLSDISVLADVAAEVGLDRGEAFAVLTDQRYASEVRKHQNSWLNRGISSVPSIIFDEQHLVPGAQGVDTYKSILTQLNNMSGAA